VNEGANGFHAFTVVSDGYGNWIAEDTHGRKIASVGSERPQQAALHALVDQAYTHLLKPLRAETMDELQPPNEVDQLRNELEQLHIRLTNMWQDLHRHNRSTTRMGDSEMLQRIEGALDEIVNPPNHGEPT